MKPDSPTPAPITMKYISLLSRLRQAEQPLLIDGLPMMREEAKVLAAVMDYLIRVKAPGSMSAYDLMSEIRCAMFELDQCENCTSPLRDDEYNLTGDDVRLCDECAKVLAEDDALAPAPPQAAQEEK